MAAVRPDQLSKDQHDELACTYAALILHDSGYDITSDKIATLVSASKNEVESYWPMLFANALKGQDVSSLLFAVGSGGSGPAAAAPGAAGAAAVEEAAAEPEKEDSEEEGDFGFDMFG